MGSLSSAAAKLSAARLLAAKLLAARLWAARLLGAGCKQGWLQAAFPKVSFRTGPSQPIGKTCFAPKSKTANGVIDFSGCQAAGCKDVGCKAAVCKAAKLLAAWLHGCRLQSCWLQGCKADGYARVSFRHRPPLKTFPKKPLRTCSKL